MSGHIPRPEDEDEPDNDRLVNLEKRMLALEKLLEEVRELLIRVAGKPGP